MNRKPGAAVAGMTLVLLTAVLVSLSMGSVRVPVLSVLGQALGLCAQRTGEYATQAYILAQVRLPRIVLCMLTGISLGVGGCVMQTLFRNPLASPFTMGGIQRRFVWRGIGNGAGRRHSAAKFFVYRIFACSDECLCVWYDKPAACFCCGQDEPQ